ncbi:hypothetical protein [Niallia endozanthoxylica]|uniref:Uncharacterized protein n=1 Tax=Niallia endozanthoxylica TaxID=2036016 RepID=A0A5J5HVK1_9BACI|nr:hypothetical protein [Niallia endozanthoxylica]KAA9025688.1 hypothetical protein F4V44_07280 [Niallia endozanthoxylica]
MYEQENKLNQVTAKMTVATPEELKRALTASKGIIVLIFHELEFYESWITKIWNVEDWSQNLVN